jgi:hypothetical protein
MAVYKSPSPHRTKYRKIPQITKTAPINQLQGRVQPSIKKKPKIKISKPALQRV